VRSEGGLETGTSENNCFDYYDLKQNYQRNDNCFYDENWQAAYISDPPNKILISYDTPRSIRDKLNLVIQKLGGLFAWEISGDTSDFELLREMNGSNQPQTQIQPQPQSQPQPQPQSQSQPQPQPIFISIQPPKLG